MSVWSRIRWVNVARAAAGMAAVVVVIAWPRLGAPPPTVPDGAPIPIDAPRKAEAAPAGGDGADGVAVQASADGTMGGPEGAMARSPADVRNTATNGRRSGTATRGRRSASESATRGRHAERRATRSGGSRSRVGVRDPEAGRGRLPPAPAATAPAPAASVPGPPPVVPSAAAPAPSGEFGFER